MSHNVFGRSHSSILKVNKSFPIPSNSARRNFVVDPLTPAGRYETLPRAPRRAAILVRPVQGMRDTAVVDQILLTAVLIGLSSGITWALCRVKVLDIPNARSSHDRPVPRIGGIAIVATFFVGLSAFAVIGNGPVVDRAQLIAFVVSSLGIAIVGFLDDLGRLRSTKVKFGAQVLAALLLVIFGLSFRTVSIPFVGSHDLGAWGAALTVLWLVGITNAVNFMDGLDGLVAGTCVLGAVFLAIVTFTVGGGPSFQLCILIVASTLGFLFFNYPRASIFMGDVGSQFLGFSFGALAVLAAGLEIPPASVLIVPLVFFHFIFDTLFTFFRRLISGENVSQAHRTHLYQLLNQFGFSHRSVSWFHFGMTITQGIGAILMSRLVPEHQLVVFVPFLVFEVTYAVLVIRQARTRGLLDLT